MGQRKKEMEYCGLERAGEYHECVGNPIMQYTCLKDKNGKDIYEGDIVSNEFGEKIICYESGAFIAKEIVSGMKIFLYFLDFSKLEINGNIYES